LRLNNAPEEAKEFPTFPEPAAHFESSFPWQFKSEQAESGKEERVSKDFGDLASDLAASLPFVNDAGDFVAVVVGTIDQGLLTPSN
jgi:hypothetical protein